MGPSLTWSQLKEALQSTFRFVNETEYSYDKLQELTQGRDSVTTFYISLRRLVDTPGLEEVRDSERLLCLHFRRGLSPNITKLLVGRTFEKLDALYAAAVEAEQLVRADHNRKTTASTRLAAIQYEIADTEAEEEAEGSTPYDPNLSALHRLQRGRGGGRRGGRGRGQRSRGDGSSPQVNPGGTPKPAGSDVANRRAQIKCYQCGGMGHYQSECPSAAAQGN